jgi:putative tryptophan/tyrosine transport system substrate-binding protein
MKRREFVTLIGGAAAWPLKAWAQQSSTKIARVGIIDDAPIWDNFRQALRELGYIEGRNITFEYRVAGGQPDRLATAASDLVDLPVDIIVVFGSAATRAARQATATIPIVMTAIGDPVGAGFVQNLAQPGGNITGNAILSTEMTPKRVELLKELVPNMSRVAFLWNSNNPSHLVNLDAWRAAAPTLGIEPQFIDVTSFDQFEPAFRATCGSVAML